MTILVNSVKLKKKVAPILHTHLPKKMILEKFSTGFIQQA